MARNLTNKNVIMTSLKNLEEVIVGANRIDGYTFAVKEATIRYLTKGNRFVNLGVEETTKGKLTVVSNHNSFRATKSDTEELAGYLRSLVINNKEAGKVATAKKGRKTTKKAAVKRKPAKKKVAKKKVAKKKVTKKKVAKKKVTAKRKTTKKTTLASKKTAAKRKPAKRKVAKKVTAKSKPTKRKVAKKTTTKRKTKK